MSNKTQLQTNNTTLDSLITRLNNATSRIANLEGASTSNPFETEETSNITVSYIVERVNGANYGFTLNGEYYENENSISNSSMSGYDNTAAVCKVNINISGGSTNIIFEGTQSSESASDYGIFGSLDSDMSTSYDDTTGYETLYNKSGEYQVIYENVSEGDHYIYIKYRKDSSSYNGEDRMTFKVCASDGKVISGNSDQEWILLGTYSSGNSIPNLGNDELHKLGITEFYPVNDYMYGYYLPPSGTYYNENDEEFYITNYGDYCYIENASGTISLYKYNPNYNPYGISNEIMNKIIESDTDLKAENIKEGVYIYGVTGEAFKQAPSSLSPLIEKTLSTYTNSRVSQIGDFAFASAGNLKSINFSNCTSIGNFAFNNCQSLSSISFPNCITIGDYAFSNCSSLTSLYLPSCKYIGVDAFYSCSNLNSINLPLCTSVCNGAFAYCSKLSYLYLPSCTSFGGGQGFRSPIYNCTSLTSVSLPNCIYLGSHAFESCNFITSATFSKCTHIYSQAFSNCSNLITVSMSQCKYIGSSVFAACYKLTNVSLPLCSIIGSYAFRNCSNLTSLYLPSCKYIYDGAFYYCSKLSSISAPACNILSGSAIFTGCSKLSYVDFPACISISGAWRGRNILWLF